MSHRDPRVRRSGSGTSRISGNAQSQNLFRTPDPSTWEYIQNRNTAHLRLDYDWLQGGKFITKYDIPFIEKSSLALLWRGVYDGIYGFTPGFLQKEDIHGRNYTGPNGGLNYFQYATQVGIPASKSGQPNNKLTIPQLGLNSLGQSGLDTVAFQNQLRELYADVKFRSIPLSIRGGRQQIVWGETDNFRMLDRINSLDLTWHLQQEIPPPAFGWDQLRRPQWMIKFLYDLGNVWKISQSFLEWYWNPGDWYPAKETFLPRPWGLPFYNPLTNPVDGAFFDGPCFTSKFKETSGPRSGQPMCTRLLNNTRLFQQGDYARNPMENSQVAGALSRDRAVRHGVHPQLLLPALRRRQRRHQLRSAEGAAARSAQSHEGCEDHGAGIAALADGIFPAEAYFPYVHTLGGCRPTAPPGVHPGRVPLRVDLRHGRALLRRLEGRRGGHARAPRRHQEGHVEGHDGLRPSDVDQVAQQEEHVVPHRTVLLAPHPRLQRVRRAGRREPLPAGARSPQRLFCRRPRPAVERSRLARLVPRQDPELGVAVHARGVLVLRGGSIVPTLGTWRSIR